MTYAAGANGAIEGAGKQKVERGGTGSTVSAVPVEGYHFSGWSDGVATASRTDANVTTDLTVTAVFAANQYTLAYAPEAHGSIVGTATQSVEHGGAGTEVTAVPAVGFHFVGWSDGVATASRTDANVTTDLTITALFAVNQYTLTYAAGEHGRIIGSSPQRVEHGGDGSQVSAVPAEHHHFAGWSDGVATASRTDRGVTADLSVTAAFAINQYVLSYTPGEHGSVEGAGQQTVIHGGSGSPVRAVPAEGYHFVGWTDGVASAIRTDAGVTADLAVTASFSIDRHYLNYTAGAHGAIEGESQQLVEHGGSGTAVAAVPEKGYHFVRWSDGRTDPSRLDANVKGDLAVSASFAVNTYTVGGRVSGLVAGTRLVLQNQDGEELAMTADGDFRFAAELLDGSPYQVTVLTQPTTPNQTCTVSGSAGVVSGENVTAVLVECVLRTYTAGGTVSGLPEGDQVDLRNGKDSLEISANGPFVFPKALDDGSAYEVKVHRQPKKPNWTCEVEHAAGVVAGQDVTDITVDCYPEVVLQAMAGIRKIKVNWNSHDFGKDVAFDLCVSQEDIPADGYGRCRELRGGMMKENGDNPLILAELTNDVPYWLQLGAHYAGGRQTLSKIVKATPYGGLNDSGIDWCADGQANRSINGTRTEKTTACESLAATYPGQDALSGRDAAYRHRTLTKNGHGSAGFDFTKVCRSGEVAGEGECAPNPAPGKGRNNWGCTRDNATGLMWEVKTESGLQNRSNTYTWYNPDDAVNGGNQGVQNGGSCEGSDCDTSAYIKTFNEQGVCGASDWRLPTRRELLSIVDNGRFRPAIDARFFPNTLPSYFWTSSPAADQEGSAWQVYFFYGEALSNSKKEKNHIRLVRGRTVTFGMENP